MTDLTELRGALEDRADAFDGHRPDRVAAVHDRVRGVRRRRRAAAAAGLVAVLAVVVGVAVLPQRGGDGPEPVTLAGIEPPATMTALGFTYDYADGVEGRDGTARLRLAASVQPRLVSWATSGDDDRVRVTGIDVAPLTHDTDDFTEWYVVPAGREARLAVTASTADAGDPAIAVYTASRTDLPAGVSGGGVVFRDRVDGDDLLGAAIGEPGQAEVSFSAVVRRGGVRLSSFCSGPRGAYVVVSDERGELSAGSCDDPLPLDAGASSGSGLTDEPGTVSDLRMRVTEGRGGPVLADPDLRIGLAAYDPRAVAGFEPADPVPSLEAYGHVWRLVGSTESGAGRTRAFSTTPRGPTPFLVVFEAAGGRRATPEYAGADGAFTTNGVRASVTGLLSPGEPFALRSSRGGPLPEGSLRLAVYEQADVRIGPGPHRPVDSGP